MRYELKSNPQWPLVSMLPKTTAETMFNESVLSFTFDVVEPQNCFRQVCFKDGNPCWQDSCVEVFLASPARNGYFNFETSSSGACLAEFGQSRAPRRVFMPEEYTQIRRTVIIEPKPTEPFIHWTLKIEIPRVLLGISAQDKVFGNLYKCASNAKNPHYLSAFPVYTETPDFHRPEFFRELKDYM